MKNRGFTLVELLATIVIAAIIITLAVSGFNGISGKIKQTAYENKVSYIEVASANYGDDTGESAVFVDTLVKEGYIEPDNEDGEVLDPRDKTPMNCYVVIISYENDNVYGKFTEEEIKESDGKTCDKDKLKDKYLVVSLKLYEATNDTGTSWDKEIEAGSWTRSNVVLIAEIDNEMKSKVSKITFMSNEEQADERLVNKDYDSKNKKYITASQLKNIRYIVKVETKEIDSEGKEIINTYISSIRVKIDKQRPIIYDSTVVIEGENNWTNNGKKVKVIASDGNGSGIYGFSISTNRDCKNASYTPSSSDNDTYEITIENIGEYYICAKDNAGNVSEDESTKKIVIDKIDTTPPKCEDTRIIGENTKWTKDSVTITLEGVDYESGSNTIITKTYSSGEIAKDTIKYTIYDNAGNSTECEKEVNIYLDKTPPSCNWSGENSNWTNKDVTVTLTGIDKGSGSDSVYKKVYATGAIETERLSYTIYDKAGNSTVCEKEVEVNLDKIPPSCNWSGENSVWTNKDVYINLIGSDDHSGSDSQFTWSYTDGTKKNDELSYTIYDKAGNSTKCERNVGVFVDKTPPSCYWRGENYNWTKNNVTVTLMGIDSGSGSSSVYSNTYSSSKETDKLSYTVYDNVGNSRLCEKEVGVYIDKEPPTITFLESSNNGLLSPVHIYHKFKINDNYSGISKYYFGTDNPDLMDVSYTELEDSARIFDLTSDINIGASAAIIALDNATYTYYLRVIDDSGNSATTSYNIQTIGHENSHDYEIPYTIFTNGYKNAYIYSVNVNRYVIDTNTGIKTPVPTTPTTVREYNSTGRVIYTCDIPCQETLSNLSSIYVNLGQSALFSIVLY